MGRARGVTVVLGAFILKLAFLGWMYSIRPRSFLYVDSGTYVRPALALLIRRSFSPSLEAAPAPEINRTPGYPLLIAAVYGAFGEKPWVLSAVNVFFAAGTALVLMRMASRLLGEAAGTWAAVLISLEPGTFFRSVDILSDTPFTFFMTLFLAALVSIAHEGRRNEKCSEGEEGNAESNETRREAAPASASRDVFFCGLWLALATLVRPLSYYLVFPAALFTFEETRRRNSSVRQGIRATVLFISPFFLLAGGWQARNHLRAGTFSISPIGSSELLFYRAAPVAARAEGVSVPEMQERLGNRERYFRSGGGTEGEIFGEKLYADLFPETSKLSLPELGRRWRRQALGILASHPVLALGMAAKGACLLLLAPPNLVLSVQYGLLAPEPALLSLYEDQRVGAFLGLLARLHPAAFALALAFILLLAALEASALAGLARTGRKIPKAAHIALVGTFLYLVAVSSGAESNDDRYRLPLVPIICLYAAARVAEGAKHAPA